MRRISAICAASLLLPLPASADAQFTADDNKKHFRQSPAAAAAPAPSAAASGVRPVVPDEDEPIALPLTGAKRGVTLGAASGRAKTGTTVGTRVGTKVGTTVGGTAGSSGLDLLITFESGSDRLTPQAMRNLDTFAEALRNPALMSFSFEVQGHTDAKGGAEVNMRLSQRRAESVVSYLINHGIDGNRLQARGYGESRPIMSDPNHPQNRRVETRRIQ